jgi:hypothetical protein
MANVSAPFGFRQAQGTGSSPTYEQFEVKGPNGGIDYNASAIYFGDPVTRVGSGDNTIEQGPGAAGSSTVPLAGVFVGCKYLSTAQKRITWSNYWPGSDVTSANQPTLSAYIINDPNAQFLVQSDSTGLAPTAAGANIDYNVGSGTAANGISGAYILHTAATTAAYPFRLLTPVTDPPGAPGTASASSSPATTASPYQYWIVAFNNVETRNATSTNN